MKKSKLLTLITTLGVIAPLMGCSNNAPSSFDIVWKNYDNTILKEEKYVQGQMPRYDGENPTRSDDNQFSYTFTGWTPEVTVANKNETYVATYEKTLLKALVTYNLNGGTSSHSTDPILTNKITSDKFFYDVSKENFNFRGWSYENELIFDEFGTQLKSLDIEENMEFVATFDNQVKLTIVPNIEGPYSFVGEGIYDQNSNVPVIVQVPFGYEFLGWFLGDLLLDTDENFIFNLGLYDCELNAKFELQEFDVNVYSTQPKSGRVKVANDFYWGIESSAKVKFNEYVTVFARSLTGTQFVGWYNENDELVSTKDEFTFKITRIKNDLYAKWEADPWILNVSKNYYKSGTITAPAWAVYNERVTVSFEVNEGYNFLGWFDEDNICLSNELTCTFLMPDNDYSIEARTELINYTILYNLDGGQEVDNPKTYTIEDEVTFLPTSKEHYYFLGWVDEEGNEITKIEKGTTGLIQITATYRPDIYNVILFNPTQKGTLAGGGLISYLTSTTVNAYPNSGFVFAGWYRDSRFEELVSLEASYTFIVLGDVTLYALFEQL